MNKKIIPAEASFFVPVEKVLFDHSRMRRSLETAATENYPALTEDILWDYTLFTFEKKKWSLISITDRSTYGEECIRHSSRPNSEYVLYSYGEPVAMTNDSGTSYFGTDILGSVRNVTDKYGTVQADYSYDAFGSPYLGNLENDIGFGYCGKVYDIGTGLYDYGFRDYSPVSARFTTIDPIRDGSNWFSYVVNDPVNYIDPFGLDTTDSKSDGINFNSNVLNSPYIGYTPPNFTVDITKLGSNSITLTNNSYFGIDTGNSILVACGSMSTIGNCFGSKANKGFSFGDGTTLGYNDVYIGGQNNESQSSKMIKQASIEFFIGSFLDNGAPLIGGAIASFTGGSGALAIPVIKAFGISLEIDASAKLTKATLLAVEENSGGDSKNKEDASSSKPENKSPEGAGRRGALNKAKRKNGVPTSQQPEEQTPNYDKRGNKQPGRQYKYRDSNGNPVNIRDDSQGHTYPDDPSQNRGPHFNDEAGNHYDY